MSTLKGAFVRYEDSLISLPNIIVFQFNPETMTRNLPYSRKCQQIAARVRRRRKIQ